MSRTRVSVRPLIAAVLAALLVAALVTRSQAAAPSGGAAAAAERLAAEPDVDRSSTATVPSDKARAAAAERAPSIPLPTAGNFNGIQWEGAEGLLPTAVLEGVLEYNAACQWLRARRDGRDTEDAGAVLRTVPSWPALRGTDAGTTLAAAIRGDEAAQGVLASCDASALRQQRYAASLGLTPSA